MRQLSLALLVAAATAAQPGVGGVFQHRYHVTNLASLGGTSSVGNSINDRGWVAGRSNLPGNLLRHATLWRNGALTDLGSLGGPGRNSAVLWPVKNLFGVVSGITQTAMPDPLHENWSCSFFFPAATATGYQCVGFRWKDGVMTPLPTLGGTHGFATGTNNWGLTVGWAENTVRDPTCVPPQVLQFRAVVWGPNNRVLRELPPIHGDTVTAATAINDRNQVIGISGICDIAVGELSAIHAVLWEHGTVIDLGNIGGNAWNTPMSINQRGDVVGFANTAPGIDFVPHAFIKLRGQPMRDLKTLPAPYDASSQALGINEWRQVVGQSCDADGNCHAFVWHDGAMIDLNAQLEPGYNNVLTTANDIDDFGRITGQALDPALGQRVAFLAAP